MSYSETPDIVIIGAGIAGLTLAHCLAGQGTDLEILLIDAKEPPAPDNWPASFDPRVSALTCASENILRTVGAWDWMEQQRVSPYTAMDVWDRDGVGNIQFYSGDIGASHLGHIVENRITQFALWQQLQTLGNVHFIPTRLQKILDGEDGRRWSLQLENGQQLQPTLLVGADGARSRVRDQLGFRCRSWSYGQQAIVTTVETEMPHENTARQVFLESGPLAFLPLRQQSIQQDSRLCSIVWSLDNSAVDDIIDLDDSAFCNALGAAFEQRLGAVIQADQRFRFPLQQNHAVNYVDQSVALIGDAAHSIHPLAGQGLNIGLLDAAVLAEELLQAHHKGVALDDFLVLRRYQRRRQAHNLSVMAVMDGFKRLFGSRLLPVRAARNFGMSLFNQHGMIKNTIAKHAMGLSGDLPLAAQSELLVDF